MQLPSMLRAQMSNSARHSLPSLIERQAKSSRIRKLARSSGELGAGIFFADFRTRSSIKLRPTKSALWRSPISGAALHIGRVASSVLQRILNALQQILKCAIVHGPTVQHLVQELDQPLPLRRRQVARFGLRIGESQVAAVPSRYARAARKWGTTRQPPRFPLSLIAACNSSSVGSTSLLAKLLLADVFDVAGGLVLPL